jgi:glycosyltransferase involved in cell wall biosynthesis
VNRDGPLVSIGIPTYNRASLVGRAIDSALAQDYLHLEIIVSDNASSDGTAAACQERAARDSRVRYVRQPRNVGATRNFEEVLRLASGDYFMWLGDDDWLDTDYIRLCLGTLLDGGDLSLAGGVPFYYKNGLAKGSGQVLSLLQRDRWQRVLAYFWQVQDNGLFYGLASTEVQRGLLPIRNVMGGDWLHIALLASQGPIRTLDTTRVHRETGGATTSYAQIARSLGLRPIVGRFPFSFIAWAAFADIAWRHHGYRNHSRPARLALALAVGFVLTIRGCIVSAISTRARLRMLLAPLSRRRGA